MSKKLHVSDELSLPIDAATQTFAFIARKGAGKTYNAGVLVEELLDHQVQTVILDSVGVWYGLRLDADGKRPGHDIPLLGGLRGDIPLEEGAGELIADLVVDSGRSLIIDISQLSLGARQRFAATFGERLWKRKKGEMHPSPLMLVIEECQLIVPERIPAGSRDAARMVGIYEEIIRLGRNFGIGAAMITQRPQSVNKEVLNQTECLFVGQNNGAHERKAIKEWIVHQGLDVNLIQELPGLPIGTMYVWSPQWLQILKKVKMRAKHTFDSSATPKVGQKPVDRELGPLDLGELRQKMQAVIERQREHDPKLLRAEVSRLKNELAKAAQAKPAAAAPPPVPREVEVPVLKDAQLKRIEAIQVRAEKLAGKLADLKQELAGGLAALAEASRKVNAPAPRRPSPPAAMPAAARPAISAPIRRAPSPSAAMEASNGEQVGQTGLRRILTALAQRNGMTNRQIAVRAGMSANGGSFRTYLSAARTRGWISDQGDRRFITPAGVDALGDYDPLPEGRELLEFWVRELGDSGASRILRALAQAYPDALTHEQLAEATGMSTAGGSFRTYMSKLRTLELIQTQRGETRASDELFDQPAEAL